MYQTVSDVIGSINSIVWGAPMLIIIVGVGIFLTIGLSLLPLRKIGRGFVLMWQGRTSKGSGDISAFHALMTSLSATIGTGNIAGVATAIVLGGPGAVFWMWITALVGMATKYSEAVCAVHFRETDSTGKHIGGPMYYIQNGLGPKWKWLAMLFAVMGAIAAFGIGNMVQSNSIADALDDQKHQSPCVFNCAIYTHFNGINRRHHPYCRLGRKTGAVHDGFLCVELSCHFSD